MSTAPAVVDGYFAALNEHRFADLEPLWHPDGELHAVGAPPRIGREAVLAHFPAVLAGFAEHHDRVTRVLRDGDAVVTEIRFEGRLHDGRPVAFDAVDVFDLRDGVIVRLSSWYDTAAVARQVRP
ncbi:nuclear transport factor 2 family protein [Pseudonocardia broussonetiae]|uniref:SnoaL-like domain-containing protein n=1 Tax=Pseudonocardia broussonetiae TaxID=2736640 RepID=A0A6M6JBV8_9PSEU|nr:nuclear transport factor 2 family protein [Pseudonocardia broussonetiae]QJY45424.1 SnoaL-like domain-containing protein [Pseudonocardia broussonetiae]